MSPDFARAKALAIGVLLDQTPPRLPVEVPALRLDREVRFDSMSGFCRKTGTSLAELAMGSDCLQDGCTLMMARGGRFRALVLYNERVTHPGRRRFTLAHELGHILLGHREDSELQEIEANHFAVQLLLPDALLRACLRPPVGLRGEGELAALFGVSLEMARNRIRDAGRHRWRPRPEDRALLDAYAGLLPLAGEPVVEY